MNTRILRVIYSQRGEALAEEKMLLPDPVPMETTGRTLIIGIEHLFIPKHGAIEIRA